MAEAIALYARAPSWLTRPVTRPHVVVLEPHSDDAALSAGARIAALRGLARVTVVTVAPRSSFTRDWYEGRQRRSPAAITTLRTAEARRAAEVLGAEHLALTEDEATLRFAPAEAWTDTAQPRLAAAFTAYFGSLPTRADVQTWAARLGPVLDTLRPHELWLPLAVGEHVDHHLVRDAGLLAAAACASTPRVSLYEDLPYALAHPEHSARIVAALAAVGAGPREVIAPVAHMLADKARAVSVFTSQEDPAVFRDVVARRAAVLGGEALVTLEQPRVPDVVATALDPEHLGRVRAQLEAWRAAPPARLVLLSWAPLARPADELALLAAALPHTALELYLRDTWAWQAPPSTARVSVHLCAPTVAAGLGRIEGASGAGLVLALDPRTRATPDGAALAAAAEARGGLLTTFLVHLAALASYNT